MVHDQPPTIDRVLTPRKMLINLIGFLIGLGLLGLIIARAVEHGDWGRLREARPPMAAALLGSTALSLLVNGSLFWISVQPLRRLRFRDMQWLNLSASILNYAPLRLGAVARVLYHVRVDRLSLLQVGGWFAFTGFILLLAIGSCVLATLARGRMDAWWAALIAGQLVLAGMLLRALVAHPLIARTGAGLAGLVSDRRALWGSMALRLVDIGAFTGRMAAALAILGIHLPLADVVVLALVALSASLIPFGRLGFREACVTLAAARLSDPGTAIPWEQLALVESAGEALVCLPGGAAALVWYRRRWLGARSELRESTASG